MGWKKDGIVPDRHYEDPSRGSFALHLDVPLFLDLLITYPYLCRVSVIIITVVYSSPADS